MNNAVISVLRTYSPIVAGAIITWLVAHGFGIDASVTNPLADVLFAGASAAYYAVVRLLESHVHGGFGWLLLAARKPNYRRKDVDLAA